MDQPTKAPESFFEAVGTNLLYYRPSDSERTALHIAKTLFVRKIYMDLMSNLKSLETFYIDEKNVQINQTIESTKSIFQNAVSAVSKALSLEKHIEIDLPYDIFVDIALCPWTNSQKKNFKNFQWFLSPEYVEPYSVNDDEEEKAKAPLEILSQLETIYIFYHFTHPQKLPEGFLKESIPQFVTIKEIDRTDPLHIESKISYITNLLSYRVQQFISTMPKMVNAREGTKRGMKNGSSGKKKQTTLQIFSQLKESTKKRCEGKPYMLAALIQEQWPTNSKMALKPPTQDTIVKYLKNTGHIQS